MAKKPQEIKIVVTYSEGAIENITLAAIRLYERVEKRKREELLQKEEKAC